MLKLYNDTATLQDIIAHTAAMGGWRLSASGALIPPQDLLTSGLPNAAVQKRGSERLFQYLEADGSDTEDYSRYSFLSSIKSILIVQLSFKFNLNSTILNITFTLPTMFLII